MKVESVVEQGGGGANVFFSDLDDDLPVGWAIDRLLIGDEPGPSVAAASSSLQLLGSECPADSPKAVGAIPGPA